MTENIPPAAVQYTDWVGTLAGDDVDMMSLGDFLGVDRDKHRILVVDYWANGGHQNLVAYGVPAHTGWDELELAASSGTPVELIRFVEIELDVEGHGDTNPPRPSILPLASPADLFVLGFKRLHIRFATKHLPPGLQLRGLE